MSALKRSLGAVSGTTMMLNIVLGAGLFILPGLVAQATGTSSLVYWAAAIILSIPLLIAFSALATNLPSAGGVASIIGHAFGPAFYTISSCLFLGAVCLGLPGIALTAGYSIEAAFGINEHLSAGFITITALLLNLLKSEYAKRLGSTASIFCMVIIIALITFSIANSDPVVSWADTLLPKDMSLQGFTLGLAIIPLAFFAFTGWEVAISLGGEFKNPQRNLPLAVAVSFIIASLLYIGCVIAVLLVGKSAFNEAPFVYILTPILGDKAGQLIALFIGLFIMTNLFSAFWGVSRMIYDMGASGVLPSFLGVLSDHLPKPALMCLGTALLMVISLNAYGWLGIDTMLTLASLNFLTLYGLVSCVGAIKLPRLFLRCLSAVSILTVGVIMSTSASYLYLLYPAIIAGAGAVLHHTRKTSS